MEVLQYTDNQTLGERYIYRKSIVHPGGKFMAASLAINCDNATQQELKEMRRRRYRASWNGPPLSAIAYWHLSHTNTHTQAHKHT